MGGPYKQAYTIIPLLPSETEEQFRQSAEWQQYDEWQQGLENHVTVTPWFLRVDGAFHPAPLPGSETANYVGKMESLGRDSRYTPWAVLTFDRFENPGHIHQFNRQLLESIEAQTRPHGGPAYVALGTVVADDAMTDAAPSIFYPMTMYEDIPSAIARWLDRDLIAHIEAEFERGALADQAHTNHTQAQLALLEAQQALGLTESAIGASQ